MTNKRPTLYTLRIRASRGGSDVVRVCNVYAENPEHDAAGGYYDLSVWYNGKQTRVAGWNGFLRGTRMNGTRFQTLWTNGYTD